MTLAGEKRLPGAFNVLICKVSHFRLATLAWKWELDAQYVLLDTGRPSVRSRRISNHAVPALSKQAGIRNLQLTSLELPW